MPSSIPKALNELPVTLDDTYERILLNIPKQRWQHAHRLFQCMVAARRPLRVEELAEMFAIGFEPTSAPNLVEEWRPENAEEAVFSACSTLITTIINSDGEGSKMVQFSHFLVKEYLTPDRLQTSDVTNIRQFYISLDPAHAILARACLAVLLQLEEKVDKDRLAMFPPATYTARNWWITPSSKMWHLKFRMPWKIFLTQRSHTSWNGVRIHNMGSDNIQTSELEKRSISTPLFFVAFCGFSGLAKHLIITRALDVNAKVHNDWTPLFAASHVGHVDVVQLLLDYGSDVNALDIYDQSPLHMASFGSHVNVVQLLLEHGANVNTQDNYDCYTPLHWASEEGELEITRPLLDHGADAHIRNRDGLTPFQMATRYWYHDVAQLLLDHGAERE